MAGNDDARATELAKWQMAATLTAVLLDKHPSVKDIDAYNVGPVQTRATMLLKAMKAAVDDAMS